LVDLSHAFMSLFLAILTPFLGAPLVAWLALRGRPQAAWAAGGVALLALAQLFPAMAGVFAGHTTVEHITWIPTAGLDLAFRLDGLGLLFALLILGIGLLVILYAHYYLSAQDSLGRLYAYLLLFMGSMLGVVLSENLIQLLIFWELTSLSSFLLIAYWRKREAARRGASRLRQ
jgi:multicomponent K+:H+ antiporter subunit A